MNFDFLKELSHHHSPRYNEPPAKPESPPNFQPSQPSSSEKSIDSFNPYLPRRPRQKPKRVYVMSPPSSVPDDATLQFLIELSVQSERLLPNATSIRMLGEKQRSIEEKVYIREMSSDEEMYLKQLRLGLKGSNPLQQLLEGMMDDITKNIQLDILNHKGYRVVKQGKHSLEVVQKGEPLLQIRVKEEMLKEKIGELTIDIHSVGDIEKNTKEFLKQKQQEKLERRKKKLEKQLREKQSSQKKAEATQEEREREKAQKHQKLAKDFQEKIQKKQEYQEQAKAEKQKFASWLKQYKSQKPLYQLKEEEFRIKEQAAQEEKYGSLEKRYPLFEPIDFQELDVHSQRYMELRRDEKQRKKAEMELVRQEEAARKKILQQKMYRGKYRYLMLKEMAEKQEAESARQEERENLAIRKVQYSQQVQQNHKPTVDPAKRKEIEAVLNRNKHRRSRKSTHNTPNRVLYGDSIKEISTYSQDEAEPDSQKEGHKNFRLFKQYIHAKIEKGEIKKPQPQIATLEPKPNYLAQLRERREERGGMASERLDRSTVEDVSLLRLKAEGLDGKVQRTEVLLKHNEHRPSDERKLEDEYLQAIKAKLHLIKNCN